MCQSGEIYISYPLNVVYYIGAYRIKSGLENLIKKLYVKLYESCKKIKESKVFEYGKKRKNK